AVPGEEWEGAHEKYRLLVMVFFSIHLFACLLFNFWPPAGETITGLILIDTLLVTCGLVFAYMLKDDILPLLRWNNFRVWRLGFLIMLAIGSAIVVNMGVRWVNE